MYNVENQYLDLLNTVMVTGQDRKNRTDVKTRMIHGALLRHNCDTGFPLLTSKKVSFDSIKAELLWFLSGSTDCADLDEYHAGHNIWKANAKDYYDKRVDGMTENEKKYWGVPSETDCGLIYGHNWRNMQATHKGMLDYRPNEYGYYDNGFDQIKYVVDEICNSPDSRRIMFTGLDPVVHFKDKEACLPPCHVLCQFDVDQNDMRLNASVYMRSGDLFLGVPFNLASYALLMEIVSYLVFCRTGLRYKPGMLVMYIHDAHIYHNHFDAVLTQLSRKDNLYQFPKINFKTKKDFTLEDLDKPKGYISSITISDYKHHPYIKAEMVV